MKGFLSLVLHAHLPFVRHPEHERFLEENWLFEAITETYIPLLQTFEGWQRDGLKAHLALTLTPTLCSMLQDPLLQQRYSRHLDDLIALSEQEIHRTLLQKPFHKLAIFNHERLVSFREYYRLHHGDLISRFRSLQDAGILDIITCAATHAVLPLMADQPESIRAQVLIGRDHYQECFGRPPIGIWLPECAYVDALDPVLQEAGLRWFVVDAHGILHARPKPQYAIFAPVLTRNGLAAFGRDIESAKQVWSRDEGYPGDFRYRDFYRDIGFDLDLDYLRPYLAAPDQRTFTGIKYFRITGRSGEKEPYEREKAIEVTREHASHFLASRLEAMSRLAEILDRPPIVLCPYDAELYGHWWYEGVEFLDCFVRKAAEQSALELISPSDYLDREPLNQVATPAASTWGEGGHLHVWLNEKNHWIYQHLRVAQDKMSDLVTAIVRPTPFQDRALRQAARELLLAQSSDWAFILRTGTSPEYARKRFQDHLERFNRISELARLNIAPAEEIAWLEEIESRDNIFPNLDYRYWLRGSEK